MVNLSLAVIAAVVASASAFVAPKTVYKTTALKASDIWDPMGLYELGSGEAFDTFPNMFPAKQYLDDAEKKNGRMAMLGWTGIWATHQVRSFWNFEIFIVTCWQYASVSNDLQRLRE